MPKDVTVTEEKLVYSVGETIQCSARGNPAPSVIWQEYQDGTFFNKTSEGTLIVTGDMQGNNTYRCVASNKIGTIDRTISFEVFSE